MANWEILKAELSSSSDNSSMLIVSPPHLFDKQFILQEFPKSKLRKYNNNEGIVLEVNCDYSVLFNKFMQYINENNWEPFTVDGGWYCFKRQRP